MNYQDKIITSIASLSTKQSNPITEYSENFNAEQLAELCVFNYCYSWLYILEENKISMTDENIRRFQLACNLVTNKITSNTIDPIEFLDMFRERYENHRKDLGNFKESYEFPKYLYLRLFRNPMEKNKIDSNSLYPKFSQEKYVDEQYFEHCYVNQVNFLQTHLENIN